MTQAARAASQNLLTRLSKDMLDHFYAEGFWQAQTIYDCAQAVAGATPQKVAIRDSHTRLTYGELVGLADAVAADLATAGLKAGDRVAAWLSSRAETAVMLLACARNGLVFCPSLHRNHTVAEIGELLERMNARALVAETGYGADADAHDIFALAASRPAIARLYRLAPPRTRTGADMATELLGGQTAATVPASGLADDVVYLAFTSGTTGQPKGVMHSNNTLLANARSLAADWAFDAASVVYTLSPLSHNLGFGALVLTLLVGGEIVLHDLPRGRSLAQRLDEVGASFIFGVPAHAMDLLHELEQAPDIRLPRLKGFRISGAAAPSVVVEKLLAHGIVPQSGFGMTEACSHHYTLPTDAPARIVGTSGKACPGYEVRVFSASDPDVELPAGEVGHIAGRGASLMLGYFDDQTATERSFNRDGWFLTGDLGRVDQDGYLQITGRIKDIIIRGGHNIHPAHIERLTSRYPGVERAAAIPVKDERLGEKVCIVVMPANGNEIDPQKLLSHLHAEGLSKYDMPEYFLQVSSIPLGPSGKILKRALLPEVEAGRLTPQPIRWGA